MNKMKVLKIFSISVAATAMLIFATSCGKTGQNGSKQQTAEAQTAMQVDDLLAGAEQLVGDTVNVEGVCTHICKHAGRKIFLMGSDDTQTIRVESGSLGSFKQECVNSIVAVTGILREERIDEAYLQQWEAKIKTQTAEEHGNSAAGCDTEKKARQETGNTPQARIDNFRKRIAQNEAETGKAYLSFYYLEATGYKILP